MTAFLGFVLAIFTGPVCPEGVLFHACDPNERMELLLHTSDDLPTVREGWRRFWMSDQPSHLTYHRVHGGVDADLPVLFGACRVPKWTREEYLLQLPGVWRHFWRNDPSDVTYVCIHSAIEPDTKLDVWPSTPSGLWCWAHGWTLYWMDDCKPTLGRYLRTHGSVHP